MTGERRGLRGVLRSRADDDRQAGGRQALDALHPLLQSQERPVAHRSAIDDPGHPRVDQLAAGARRGRRNPGADRRRRASSGPEWFRKKLARTCWRFLELGRHVRHIRMSSPSVLDEKTGRRLKMRKTAPAAAPRATPAAAFAAVLGRPFTGDRAFRSRRRHCLLHQGSRGPLRRGQPDARGSLQLWRQAGAHRPQGERGRSQPPLGERFEAQDLKVIAEGLSIRGRMELHLYPDGREGWCLTWKEPLVDADGVVRGLAGISRDAPAFVAAGTRSRRRCPPRSPTSTTISTSRCAFPISRRAPASRRSSSTRGFGLCSASPPANICPACGSTGRATGSGAPRRR